MDRIYGKFLRVVDGDTLDIAVTRRDGANEFDYRNTERIRLDGRDAPETGTPGALAAQRALHERFRGRNLRVNVFAHDRYGRLIGYVTKTPRRQ
jgi:endonuclease YncB( thermonuclease family)